MKNYLAMWAEGSSDENSRGLTTPITVIGGHLSVTKSEFAKVQLTVHPANAFEVLDHVTGRGDLEELGVGWPDPVILGLIDVLMAGQVQLRNVRVVLEQVWYHDVDSTQNAFRGAGRDAGRKIIEAIQENAYRA